MIAIQKTPWLERTFPFGQPVGMFPNVLERLRGTPARLEDRLRGVPAARLTARPAEGWSIQELVGHLVQTEELHVGRVDDFLAGAPVLRAALYQKGRVESARFNERPLEELLREFRAARSAYVRRLEALSAADVERMSRHPRLQRDVNVLDMMAFTAEHDDHHLARISELLAAG